LNVKYGVRHEGHLATAPGAGRPFPDERRI
jgi:hypothetical protein